MLSTIILAAQGAAGQSDNWLRQLVGLAPIILMAVFFIWMMSRAKRQEQRQREGLLASLKKNDRVLTSGGLIGIVAALKDSEDEVTLKVDESSNVRLRVLKSAIVRVLGSETAEKDQKSGAT